MSIGNAIGGGVQRCHNGVLGFVSGMINGFINSINWATQVLSTLFLASYSKYRTLNIPQLAEEWYRHKSNLAMIGEGSEPEAVSLLVG